MNIEPISLADATAERFEALQGMAFVARPEEFPGAPPFQLTLVEVQRAVSRSPERRAPFSLLFSAELPVDAPVHALVTLQGGGAVLHSVYINRVSLMGSRASEPRAWFEAVFA